MSTGRHILIVSQNQRTVTALIEWLSAEGFELSVVNTFAAGKTHLASHPDVLITDLKLQEHNGLHLALRAQTSGVAAIVLGPDDPVLAKDAFALGANYFSALPTRGELVKLVTDLLIASRGQNPDALASDADAQIIWNYLGNARSGVTVDALGRRVLLH